jgi:thiol-disulfide isomerase/thioredoxin
MLVCNASGWRCVRAALGAIVPGIAAMLYVSASADTAADTMLDRCISAERKAASLEADFTLQGSDIRSVKGHFTLRKPNWGHIELTRDGTSGSVITHSDAKRLLIYSTTDKQYSTEPVDVTGGNITRDCELLEAAAFFNPDLLDRMRYGHKARLIATATLSGVPCRVVQVIGDAGSIWKVFIGPDDLLRGYSQKAVQGDLVITRESRVTHVKVNASVPAQLASYRLPKGASSVQEVMARRNTPSSGTGSEEQGLLPIGKTAPAFTLTELSGASVSLGEACSKGKVTLVNFWNAGCGPCREELPQLSRLLEQLKGKGLNIYSVNLGDDRGTVAKIWSQDRLGMHAVLGGEKISEQYRIQAIPTNYVLDPSGKILARFMGFDEQGIRAALAKAGVR